MDRIFLGRGASANAFLWPFPVPKRFLATAATLFGAFWLAHCISAAAPPAMAKAAEAAKPPVKIAILINTTSTQCFDNGDVPAVKRLVALRRDRINEAGGIAGRRLILEFLDDQADGKKTIANVRSAIADKQTVAIIGLQNSTRAKEVFDTAGEEIKSSGMPWISSLSVNSAVRGLSDRLHHARGAGI